MRRYIAFARSLALLPVAATAWACGARSQLRTPAPSDTATTDATEAAVTGADATDVRDASMRADVVTVGTCVNLNVEDGAISCGAGSTCIEIGGALSTVRCLEDASDALMVSPCGVFRCERGCMCTDVDASVCGCHPGIAVLPPPDLPIF